MKIFLSTLFNEYEWKMRFYWKNKFEFDKDIVNKVYSTKKIQPIF